ncbi:MAG: hypothetical protein PHW36_00665 [Bacilli bacterium]|nr:hypothetical protein [Bacilli bacterium]
MLTTEDFAVRTLVLGIAIIGVFGLLLLVGVSAVSFLLGGV